MNYTYTLNDIALFLRLTNFPLSDEQIVLHKLWTEQKHIPEEYRLDEAAFRRKVRLEIAAYDFLDGMDELDLIMHDVAPDYIQLNPTYAQDFILQYFKIIRLELLYIEGRAYCKIKLRRLLKSFAYKRRSSVLIQSINHAMTLLSLTPYLKGYISCNIASIDIDDMIMIRLKQENNDRPIKQNV